MSGNDIYALILCLIVFVILTLLSAIMLTVIVRQGLRIIRAGLDDDKIKTEYKERTESSAGRIIDYILSTAMCIVFVLIFAFSLLVTVGENNFSKDVPTLRVVKSASMSFKNDENKYLFDNKLNNQFDTFDLILTYNVPPAEELRMYDIVVYEVDKMLIVHRIVGIEQPNAYHPDETWFLLQGDAISTPDKFPVKYEQIKAIYRDQRIPFIGSFIVFMNSPAGYLCLVLIVATFILTPFLERLIWKEKEKRLVAIGFIGEDETEYAKKANKKIEKEPENAIESVDESVLVDEAESAEECEDIANSENAQTKIEEEQSEDAFVGEDEEFAQSAADCIIERKAYLSANAPTHLTNYHHSALFEKKAHTKKVKVDLLGYRDKQEAKPRKTFAQRLARLNKEMKARYKTVLEEIKSIKGVRVIEGKFRHTYKAGSTRIARFAVRGKTVCVYLALDPKDFENTKYIFRDLSDSKANEGYALCMRLTSARQTKWTVELIDEIIKRSSLDKGGEA